MNDVADSEVLKIKISLGPNPAMGPGKADLLEHIKYCGSISAAAKKMGMSYRRAWNLVTLMNEGFETPLVVAAPGGVNGGGAQVTEFGENILRCYRDIEAKTKSAGVREISEILSHLKSHP
jgi:molybdate transport system regulatory protein